MVAIVLVHNLFELVYGLHHRLLGASLDEVIEASHHEDPHGSGLPVVVYPPCVVQVGHHSTRYGQPVNMDRVRAAGYPWLPGLMEVVEL